MDRKRLAVFGGRGDGMLLCHSARRADPEIEILGYLNDVEPPGSAIGGRPVLGPFEAWTDLDADVVFSTHLHRPGLMIDRIARLEALGVPLERWLTVIDPAAMLYDSVDIGRNVFISPLASIKCQVSIADHVAVREGVRIGHDSRIEDHVFIGQNAGLGGCVRVCRGAYIGMGAVVREHLCIGPMSVVGMGAVVVDDVPAGAVVVGNPAKLLRRDGEGT